MNTASQGQEWFLARDGKRYGPISDIELQDLAGAGHLHPNDLLWRQGLTAWIEATQIPGFFIKPYVNHPNHTDYTARSHSLTSASQPFPGHFPSHDMEDMRDFKGAPVFHATAGAQLPVPRHPHGFEGSQAIAAQRPAKGLKAKRLNQNSKRKEDKRALPAPVENGTSEASRKKGFVRRALSLTVYTVLFLSAFLLALPAIVPTDWARDQAIHQLEQTLGRKIEVRGKTTISLLPKLSLQLNDVVFSDPSFSNPSNDKSGNMHGHNKTDHQNKKETTPLIQIESIRFDIALMPLFKRHVEMDRVVLKRPKLSLALKQDGRNNWSFLDFQRFGEAVFSLSPQKDNLVSVNPLEQILGIGSAQAQASLSSQQKYIQTLRLGKIQIVDGALTYLSEKTRFSENLQSLNFEIDLPADTAWVNVKGHGVWKTNPVEFTLNIRAPEALVKGQASDLGLTVKSDYLVSDIKGKLSLFDGWFFSGETEVQIKSLRNFAAWMGHKVSVVGGFEPFSLTGKIEAEAHRISFKEATIGFDHTTATAQGTLLFSGFRPYLKADIVANKLDFATYTQERYIPKDRNLSDSRVSLEPDAQHLSRQQDGQEDKKKSDQPLFQSSTLKDGESNAGPAFALTTANVSDQNEGYEQVAARPVNSLASALEALDAEVKIAFKDVASGRLNAQNVKVHLAIQQGVLSADVPDFMIYTGKGAAKFTLDGTKAIPAFSVKANIENTAALSLFKDSFFFDFMSGQANVVFELQGTGHTQKQIYASLEGKGSVAVQDGTIEGLNVQQIVETYQKGGSQKFDRGAALKTPFKTFSGSFQIRNGIVENKDLRFVSPVIQMKGEGIYDLPQKSFDFVFQPDVAALTSNTMRLPVSTVKKKSAVEVLPIRLRGNWAEYHILPDMPKATKAPQDMAKEKDGLQDSVNTGSIDKSNSAIHSGEQKEDNVAQKPEKEKIDKKGDGKKVNPEEFESLLQGVLTDKNAPKKGPVQTQN